MAPSGSVDSADAVSMRRTGGPPLASLGVTAAGGGRGGERAGGEEEAAARHREYSKLPEEPAFRYIALPSRMNFR
jgi:hypothetical protein